MSDSVNLPKPQAPISQLVQSPPIAFSDFADAVIRCLNALNRQTLEDIPLNELPWFRLLQDVVYMLKDYSHAQAASIFLLSDDWSRLDCVAGAGYKSGYERTAYSAFSKEHMTTWVFKSRTPINRSRTQLEEHAQASGVPFTVRCDSILPYKLKNLIAVPIALDEGPCYGVLKLEGCDPAHDAKSLLPDADFGLARIVACVLAAACKRRFWIQLSMRARTAQEQSRDVDSFVGNITAVLTESLKSEAACVLFFEDHIGSGEPGVVYVGGVGYKGGIQGNLNWRRRFVNFVAKRNAPLVLTADELKNKKDLYGYSADWEDSLVSGSLRNALAIPLLDPEKALCFGIVLVENLLPSGLNFETVDIDSCVNVAQRLIEPCLRRFKARSSQSGAGYSLLRCRLGAPDRLRGSELMERVKAVKQLQSENREIKPGDCINFLKISRPYYYKLCGDLENKA